MNKITKQISIITLLLWLFSLPLVFATWDVLPQWWVASSWTIQNKPSAVVAPVSDKPVLIDANGVLKSNYVTYERFSFCEGDSDKWFSLKAGEEKNVCVQFQNALNMDVKLWTEIVDGYTIEPRGIRWCIDNPSGNKQFIPWVMTPSRWNAPIDIPAGKTVKLYVKMKFPAGSNGVKHACFTYGVLDSTTDLWSNFSMRFRRESYVDFIVKWGEWLKSNIVALPFDDGKTVKSYFDVNDKFVMDFNLQNTGSVDEMITIKWNVHNMFGFTQPFMLTGIRLNVGMTKLIHTSDFGITFDMPFYKWLYSIDWTIQHKPFFEFDVSGFGLDPTLLAWGTIAATGSAFFFPWLMLAALLVLILFIKMAFFKKARIVYVQQLPVSGNTPNQSSTSIPPTSSVQPPVA